MLSGREYFYEEWLDQLRAVVAEGPILDIGTPAPFNKEIRAVKDAAGSPYLWMDFCVQDGGPTFVADASRLPAFRVHPGGDLQPCAPARSLPRIGDPRGVESARARWAGYFTMLDSYPYHGGGVGYGDYHRFKDDAVSLLLGTWSAVHVLRGGGIGQVAMNYVPHRLKPSAQRVRTWSIATCHQHHPDALRVRDEMRRIGI